MRKILAQLRTDKLSLEEVWQRVVDVEQYPQRLVYISDAKATHIGAGGHYSDVTTILWVPLTIHHHIEDYQLHEGLQYRVPLPLGGTMYQTMRFYQDGEYAVMIAMVTFDLASRIYNMFVGPVVERRLFRMMSSAFPETPLERMY